MAGKSETVKDISKITSDNETSEKGYVTDDIDDEDSECKRKHKMNKLTVFSKVNGKLQVKPASSTKCKKIGKIPGHSNTTLKTKYEDSDDDGDILIYSSEDDIDNTADMAEDTKKDGPTVMETPSVKFARIVFDATDMNKGCKTMRIKTDAPMRDIKKLFPKHLSVTEDNFMLLFNNQEVEEQTPLQLFGDNLEGDHNVIKIVKSIKIRLGGEPFPKKGLYLDERPNTLFSEIRQKIAGHLKEPPALIGLVYNDKDILNDQTPESVKMVYGDVLKVFKKDKMKILFRGSITIKGPMGDTEEFYPGEKSLKELFQTYTEMHQMANSAGKRAKSYVFRFNGNIVHEDDTAKSLNMVDGDCITAGEEVTQIFSGTVLRKGFELLPMDTQLEFKNVRKHFSDQIGVDFKSLVLTIGGKRVVLDDDTLDSLNISNSGTVISVFVEQYIQVHVQYFRFGQESLSLTSKMQLGMALEEWKSEISAELGEPLHYLYFMWEDSDIADLDIPEQIGLQNGDTVNVYYCIKKNPKALQMRLNIDKKKKEKNVGVSLAKDINNHKDFENVDDILKFIGEEDSTSKTSKENKDQVGTSKRRKRKNKKVFKISTPNKESDTKVDTVDKLRVQECNREDFVVEVSRAQNDKQNEIMDIPNEDKKDPRNEQSKNEKNTIDPDGDGGNNIENNNILENFLDFIGDVDEDSTAKTVEGNVESIEIERNNLNIKETDNKESERIVKTVTDSSKDDLQDVRRSEGNDRGNKQNEILQDEVWRSEDVKKNVEKQKSFAITKISSLNNKLAMFESETEAKKEQLEEMECMIGELKSKLAIFESEAEAKQEHLEEMKCLIGELKNKLAIFESEAKAQEEQLEEDRMPASDGPKYLIQEKLEYQNVKTSHEQEIEALLKRIEEKGALFNKLEPIHKEGAANHVLRSSVENGQHEVKEVKKDCGENGQNQHNEVTKERKKLKKEKARKPYCALASCQNKGGHKCSRCKAVFYCHQDCLNEDWPHHKMFCDYVYEVNKVPDDSTSKNTSEIENTGGREEVD